MISYNDIKDIINSLKTEGIEARVRDVAYLVMCDSFVDKALAAKVAYQDDEKPSSKVLSTLAEKLKPFGIGAVTTISKDENREALLKEILPTIRKQVEIQTLLSKQARSCWMHV